MTATVKNIGGEVANQVVVRFQNGTTVIGNSGPYSKIAPRESKPITFVWNTTEIKGNRTITATADPSNTIREWIETNNRLQQVITLK